MAKLTDKQSQEQVAQLSRGSEAIYTAAELQRGLAEAAGSGRQLRVKYGMDPTAPDIHLGHTVVLRKLRQFQDLGHKAVLIIGDYTARIGDPSGENRTRPMLSGEQIEANAATYVAQAGKVLDTSSDKLEIRRNSEWLEKLSFADVIKLAAQMTVARMMERDTFELRFRDGVPIGVHEFLYPLMQGYDSVCIRSDVELGGTDQTFNNLVGRQLQANAGQPPQIVLIMPILVGLDGKEKMSKSKGNYIGVTEPPGEMFGKVMSIPDSLMRNYFTLLTDLPATEIDSLLDDKQTHPRAAKVTLGKMIVAQYHGQAAADEAAAEFDRVFAQKGTPTEMPLIVVRDSQMNVVDLIVHPGFASSKSEARRLVEQKAVSVDDRTIEGIEATVDLHTGQVLRVGKRRFGRIWVTTVVEFRSPRFDKIEVVENRGRCALTMEVRSAGEIHKVTLEDVTGTLARVNQFKDQLEQDWTYAQIFLPGTAIQNSCAFECEDSSGTKDRLHFIFRNLRMVPIGGTPRAS